MPRTSYANENRTQSRSGLRRGRNYYDEDEDYGSRRTPPRDEEGRFMSEDEEEGDYEGDYRRGSSSSRGGYSSSARGRGHGGWFSDPEGHSRAAREGWGEDEDEYRPARSRRSRSRYEEDEDEDEGSYVTDSRRGRRGNYYASSSPRGRNHGGWFGDEEGHREAAERGWEQGHRGQRSGRRRRNIA